MKMSELIVGGTAVTGMVHVYNEHASSAKLMKQVRNRLVQDLPDLNHKYIETNLNLDKTIIEIQDTVSSGDLVCVEGGETTMNTVARAMSSGELRGQLIPSLILDGGAYSDLSHMLHINSVAKRPTEVIRSSVLKVIYPIEFHIQPGDRNQDARDEIAVCYGGIGAMAKTGELINTRRTGKVLEIVRSNKLGRFTLGAILAAEGLARAKKFTIIDHKSGQDQQLGLTEFGYINGNRMAGGVILTPVEIDDKRAVRIEASHKYSLIRELAGLATGVSEGVVVSAIDDDFTLESSAWFHRDAEHSLLTKGTRISINRSTNPFYVLSDR
ncbi:MAG TPA: hypothetical protein VMV24_00130 [Candidatus Dormibacteraeota bacterium]|nr:hypothetical protein [Candidatus Dormibacteraeota bacterium]